MSHTPGPWHVGTGQADVIVYAPDGWAVGDAVIFHGRTHPDSARANARLMAAALALLKALEDAVMYAADGTPLSERELNEMRAAIRAAGGLEL